MAFEFTGTLDGPDHLDLVGMSGVVLTEAEEDFIWSITNPRELLLACPSVQEVQVAEFDELPGQSDIFFEYQVNSREQLATELQSEIARLLNRKC